MKTRNLLFSSLILLGLYSCGDNPDCPAEDWVGVYELTSSTEADCYYPILTETVITISGNGSEVRIDDLKYNLQDDCTIRRKLPNFGNYYLSEGTINGDVITFLETQKLYGVTTSCELLYTKKQ